MTVNSVETFFTVIENIQQSSPQEGLADSHTPTFAPGKQSLKFIWGAIFIIIVLNFAAFHGSLSGYFLADDFVHVDYLRQVFSGHADLLWKNFYSNWMQTLGTSFYRPFISITLAWDYLLWGANPNGFHISNFVFQTLSSVFLFLSLNSMFPSMDRRAQGLTALTAAALFACHPLHPEVVSWIIARVDSVCTTFLFLSLWLYLLARQSKNSQNRTLASLSLVAFVLSLMSKEMAITLPPTIFLYELTNSCFSPTEKTKPWSVRLKSALLASKWHIGLLLAYLGWRTFALGTVFGGYSGSIGEGMKESIWKRWFLEGCLNRLLLPFNDAVSGPRDPLRTLLPAIMICVMALPVIRALANKGKPSAFPGALSPFAIFAGGWTVIALAPTIQVFDITPTLQGGRFVYLATAPIVLLFASLIFGDEQPDPADLRPREKVQSGYTTLTAACILLSIAFICIYAYLAEKNNSPWMQASKGVQTLRDSLERELDNLPSDRKIAVMNLPQNYKGAHMLYNAAMLAVALIPPLAKTDLSERVITFEPINYGDANLINKSRLKELLKDKDLTWVFYWQAEENKLLPIQARSLKKSDAFASIPASFVKGASVSLSGYDSLHSPDLNMPATSVDFVDVELSIEPTAKEGPGSAPIPANNVLILSWTGDIHRQFGYDRQIAKIAQTANAQASAHYRFCVGELKNWIQEGNITGLKLDTTFKPVKMTVKSAKLSSGENEIPTLALSAALPADPHTYPEHLNARGTIFTKEWLGPLAYDASKIPNAKSVRYEISRPNSWFEHYSGTLHDVAPSEKISTCGLFKKLSDTGLTVSLKDLTVPGFYEFRILALDGNGKVVGYSSDPLNLQKVEK